MRCPREPPATIHDHGCPGRAPRTPPGLRAGARLALTLAADRHRHLLVSPRRERPLRRRPPEGQLHHRRPRSVLLVGLGVSRDGDRTRDAAGDAAPGRRRRAPAHGRDQERHRSDRRDDHLRGSAVEGAGREGTERLHLEARVALLRDGAGQGLHGGWGARAGRKRSLRAGAHGRLPSPARGGGGAAHRPAPSGQLHHARLLLPAPHRAS